MSAAGTPTFQPFLVGAGVAAGGLVVSGPLSPLWRVSLRRSTTKSRVDW